MWEGGKKSERGLIKRDLSKASNKFCNLAERAVLDVHMYRAATYVAAPSNKI